MLISTISLLRPSSPCSPPIDKRVSSFLKWCSNSTTFDYTNHEIHFSQCKC
jgi:hypothetical protein